VKTGELSIPIFAFDGDGLCSCVNSNGGEGFQPPPAGCPFGPTIYEGPSTSFTIGNENEGIVNFLEGTIAPGHSAYFSLEGPVQFKCVKKECTGSTSDPAIKAEVSTVSGTEPASVSGTVATSSDPDTAATASEYGAAIEWGDGSKSSGMVSGSAGSFAVSGEHTYADEGTYTIAVKITDVDNSANSATATSTVKVADTALSATGVSAISPQAFSGTVANFSDTNTTSTPGHFTATIAWGDASPSTSGTVSGSGGSHRVSGSHTYGSTGYFTVKVHIVDDGGSTADATSTVLIYGSSRAATS
jgi:hypothetical protein